MSSSDEGVINKVTILGSYVTEWTYPNTHDRLWHKIMPVDETAAYHLWRSAHERAHRTVEVTEQQFKQQMGNKFFVPVQCTTRTIVGIYWHDFSGYILEEPLAAFLEVYNDRSYGKPLNPASLEDRELVPRW